MYEDSRASFADQAYNKFVPPIRDRSVSAPAKPGTSPAAVALEPQLILLDEPLAGLNQAEAAQMADRIASLVTESRSIILIEHNLREVIRICPKLFVQDQGRYLDFGATEEVMANPKVRAAYLGEGAI